MTLFGMRIKLHILSPLIFLLLSAFSGIREAVSMLAVLSVHELAHLISAIFLHARVDEIELMPYGAAIRLYSLWETHPFKLIVISLAGPAANLIVSAFLSLYLALVPSDYAFCMPLIENGVLLAFVNLIPALPLDGGRCLTALLSFKTGMAKAVNVGVILGCVFSALLIIFSFISFIRYERLPLFPILCAVYIFASGAMEKRQAQGAALRARLLHSHKENAVNRAALILADRYVPVYEAAKFVHPDERAVYAVTDESGKIISMLSDIRVGSALMENATGNIGDIG